MSNSFLVFLVLLLAGGGGAYWYIHKDDNRLRLDTCTLRGKSGVIEDGATIEALDNLKLNVTVRGCTADSSQMCKANVRANIEGPSKSVKFMAYSSKGLLQELNTMEPFTFRKNSAITSMEVPAEAEGWAPGEYTVTVVAEDLNANKKVEKKFKFTSKF
ncbi:MAG: hypothetical protein KF760_18965 [Candidatus Eremiobacteraeota bacterium]|nr:hypothetical protein [Candidatus Eremiobacteraeota bacterium]MCW5872629.1 hypothetical protein [Candidatus Eremiobacteraeota bacterium]